MTMRAVMLAAAAIGTLSSAAPAAAKTAPGDEAKALRAVVSAELDRSYPQLDALYKDIHAHPELGMQEVRTAALLAKEMRGLGFEVTEHVGGTGLVAIYRNGKGPTVLVRTELDALPMEEKTGLPYASHAVVDWNGKPTPADHACGHDIHMAAWVGTAKALVALKSRWKGTLMFIGQPSEETVSGARAMLADRLFERFGKPDMGFALHTGPSAAGDVFYKAGVESSTSDSLEIVFHGRGGHGSTPHVTLDPIMQAARFTTDVQSVISRDKDPAKFGVVSIGSILGGTVGNIIPDTVVLRGTIRTFDEDARTKILAGVRRTANASAMMSDAPAPDVKLEAGGRAVINDEALTAKTAAVFRAAFGEHAIESKSPGYASEDYSEFIIAGVPSLFFNIGAYDPKLIAAARAKGESMPGNHTPGYAPTPEPTIRTGVEAMSLAVMNVMKP